jgi:polar amino acid transport system substrate-binding protein
MVARIWVSFVVMCTFAVAARAEPRVLKVGLHDDPPTAIKQANGEWVGISVDLLKLIAVDLDATLQFVELPRDVITSGPLPDVDIVMTLNVSQKMNARYDLSHGFYSTGLSIATVEPKKESGWAMTKRIFSGGFVLVVCGVFVLLTLVGFLMWWLEKKPVEPLPKEKAALSKALFWAFEPVIGYKASQHTTRAGRVLGTVWGLFGVVLVSGLTANLAAQLTARRLAPSVKGVEDLPHVRVGVVEHTAGKMFCDKRGIGRTMYVTVEESLAALDRGDLDAVLDDLPDLSYALTHGHPHVILLPGTLANHDYSFGLRPDSPIRKQLNTALVKEITSDAWTSVLATYLGKQN